MVLNRYGYSYDWELQIRGKYCIVQELKYSHDEHNSWPVYVILRFK